MEKIKNPLDDLFENREGGDQRDDWKMFTSDILPKWKHIRIIADIPKLSEIAILNIKEENYAR